jgi:hypothetical protein
LTLISQSETRGIFKHLLPGHVSKIPRLTAASVLVFPATTPEQRRRSARRWPGSASSGFDLGPLAIGGKLAQFLGGRD